MNVLYEMKKFSYKIIKRSLFAKLLDDTLAVSIHLQVNDFAVRWCNSDVPRLLICFSFMTFRMSTLNMNSVLIAVDFLNFAFYSEIFMTWQDLYFVTSDNGKSFNTVLLNQIFWQPAS